MTYDDRMIQAFVGKKASPEKVQWYKEAFNKFEKTGSKWKWSWAAFFVNSFIFPGAFLFYRKAPFYGLMFLIVPFLLIGALLAIITKLGGSSNAAVFAIISAFVLYIIYGGYSIYFVYRTYLKKKKTIEGLWSSEDERVNAMQAAGGPSKIFWWLLIGLIILTFLGALGSWAQLSSGSKTPSCSAPQTQTMVKQILNKNPYISMFTGDNNISLNAITTVSHDKELDRYTCKASLDFGGKGLDKENMFLQALSNITYTVSLSDDKSQVLVEILGK